MSLVNLAQSLSDASFAMDYSVAVAKKTKSVINAQSNAALTLINSAAGVSSAKTVAEATPPSVSGTGRLLDITA